MRIFYSTLFISILSLTQINIYAQINSIYQNDPTFKLVMKNIQNMDFNNAILNLNKLKSITNDKVDIMTLKLLADCYWKVRMYEESKNTYDTLLKYNSFYTVEEKFHISELFAMSGNYLKAYEYLIGLPGFENKAIGYTKVDQYYKDSLDFNLINNLNRNDTLIFPMIKKDSLFWVTNYEIQSAQKGSFISKYFSNNENRQFNDIIDSNKILSNKQSIFSNPNTYTYSRVTGKIYFTMFQDYLSKRKEYGPKYFRIAESNLSGSKVSDITVFTLGDGSYSMLQPVISADGNVVVFISNNNNNQFDLYYSKKISNSTWSNPTALKNLNSNGDEVFPSFGLDGYLYFSSNGKAGLGGLDIYKVFLKVNGGDDIVTHLPYPINSRHDDYDFNISKDGFTGSFMSKRSGEDIVYNVEYRKHIAKLKGSIVSEITQLPILGTTVYLYKQKKNNEWIISDTTVTNDLGQFVFPVTLNSNYSIRIVDEFNKINIDAFITDNPILEKLQNIPIKDAYLNRLKFTKLKTDIISISSSNRPKRTISNITRKLVSNSSLLKLNIAQNNKLIPIEKSQLNKELSNVIKNDLTNENQLNIDNKYNEKKKINIENLPIIPPYDSKVKNQNIDKEQNRKNLKIYNSQKQESSNQSSITNQKNDDQFDKNINQSQAYGVQLSNKISSKKLDIDTINNQSKERFSIKIESKKGDIKTTSDSLSKNSKTEFSNSNNNKISSTSKLISKANHLSEIPLIIDSSKLFTINAASNNFKKGSNTRIKISKITYDNVSKKSNDKESKSTSDNISKSAKKSSINDSLNLLTKSFPILKNGSSSTSSSNIDNKVTKTDSVKEKSNISLNANSYKIVNSQNQTSSATTEKIQIDTSNKNILKNNVNEIPLINSQEDIVRLSNFESRISLNPINIYTEADSIKIELFDNGNYDNDIVSILFNNQIVVSKKEIQTDIKKPVMFSFKLDSDYSKNKISIVAENLGLEPPNSALLIITDSFRKSIYHHLSTDFSHNAVFYFYKSKRK